MEATTSQRVRAHLWVRGRVQGVGFRFFVQRRAHQLRLAGFVRNLTNGRVEIVAEGPAGSVQRLIDAVRAGPPGAMVGDVDVAWETPRGEAPRDEFAFVIRGDGDG